MDSETRLTVSQLARAAGVPLSTLRFYERRALLPAAQRSAGNYRLYSRADVDRVIFIRRAQALGFSLKDIGLLVRLSGTPVPRHTLERVAGQKLAELTERIADLKRVQRGIEALLAQPCFDPAAPCPVIGALAPPAESRRRSRS